MRIDVESIMATPEEMEIAAVRLQQRAKVYSFIRDFRKLVAYHPFVCKITVHEILFDLLMKEVKCFEDSLCAELSVDEDGKLKICGAIVECDK